MKSERNLLYALLDVATLKRKDKNLEWFISHITKLDAKLVQYRNKFDDIKTKEKELLFLKSICKIPIIINDEISLIDLCDGLHLGQEDLLKFGKNKTDASLYVREKIGDKLFGLSTHNKFEILEANDLPVDYVGLGAFKNTNTKDVSNILGDKIDEIASFSKKDVAIIGGVNLNDYFKNAKYIVVGSDLYEN